MPNATPTWGDIGGRVALLLRAQVTTPITETLRERRRAMVGARIEEHRRLAEQKPRSRLQASIGFAGARTDRLYSDWSAGNYSPNFELRGSLRLMRARARQIARDGAIGTAAVRALANGVIGPDGIQLKSRVATAEGDDHTPTNDAIEAAWREWANPEYASADRHDSWEEIQRIAVETVVTDGECFLRKLPYFRNDFGFALQFIDADQVDETVNRAPAFDRQGVAQNAIVMGVEIDAYGGAVAYHILKRHPSELGPREHERVAADEIIHLFRRYRAGQTRGVTWFAPVMTNIKMLDGYTESELVAARIAAAKMGFITSKDPSGDAVGFDPDADEEAPREIEATPGVFERLAPNEEFVGFDPNNPSGAFAEFVKVILRGIARGLGLSYVTLTGDLEGANYGSQRGGLIMERDEFRALHVWCARGLHRPVYRAWVPMARLSGQLTIDGRLAVDATKAAMWKGRGWAWIDPLKDIQARILGIQHGLDSRTDALAEEGGDVDEVFKNLAAEQELAAEYGIAIEPAVAMAAPPPPQDDEPPAKQPPAKQGPPGKPGQPGKAAPAKSAPPSADSRLSARDHARRRALHLIR